MKVHDVQDNIQRTTERLIPALERSAENKLYFSEIEETFGFIASTSDLELLQNIEEYKNNFQKNISFIGETVPSLSIESEELSKSFENYFKHAKNLAIKLSKTNQDAVVKNNNETLLVLQAHSRCKEEIYKLHEHIKNKIEINSNEVDQLTHFIIYKIMYSGAFIFAFASLLLYLIFTKLSTLYKQLVKDIISFSHNTKKYDKNSFLLNSKEFGEFRHNLDTLFDLMRKLEDQKEAVENEVQERTKELVKAQKESELLFLNAPNPYMILSKSNDIVKYNKQAEKIFGFKHLNNQIFYDEVYIHHQDIEKFNHCLTQTNIKGSDLTLRIKTFDTSYRHFKLSVVKHPNDPSLIFLTFFDLESEFLLARQTKLAALGEMMDAIAHQWKQPVSAISTNISRLELKVLMSEPLEDFIPILIDRVKKQVRHMVQTLDDFRMFFRADTERSEVDIKEQIDEVLELSQSIINSKNIQIKFPKIQKIQYELIPSEFKHILLNLINNAKDAFIENNIETREIHFRLYENDTDIKIEVQDNAGGIPQNIMHSLFDAHTSTKKDSGGTGIGLYMSRQIVEKMNGTIYAKNTDDGAIFTIVLPKKNLED